MKNNRLLLASLLPPVAYDSSQPVIAAELSADGKAFDDAYLSADNALNGVTPYFSADLIQDWERVLAITPETDSGYQQRLDAVLLKLSETGGLSIPYFIRLAESIGYTITIDELQPFRAGTSRCGEILYIPDIIFTWRVNIYGLDVPVYYFNAGSARAGDRLMTMGDRVIENTFNELKPAHTLCFFRYASEIQEPLYLDGSFILDGEQSMTGYIE